jgi:hypothetical protein
MMKRLLNSLSFGIFEKTLNMTPWKLPPKEKIYEAFSVLADKRYTITDEGTAKVTSSSGDKQYSLKWSFPDDSSIVITSDDNASKWQGYTGYPIIAILMILGKLKFDASILTHFKQIAWNKLNKKFKSNYGLVVDMIINDIPDDNKQKYIREQANMIFNQLGALQLLRSV